MILRRIKSHVEKENWFAVFIDFVIVVFGVFIGLQVANWNEARGEAARSTAYLERIADDVDNDLANYRDRIKFWSEVRAYGVKGLNYAQTAQAGDTSQWELLLAYFQASQLAEFGVSSATYDEIKNAGELGLIESSALRKALSAYYIFEDGETLRERPVYRERIRGIIPIDIQNYIWENCWTSTLGGLQNLIDCPPAVSEAKAKTLVDSIASQSDLMEHLRYWVSTLRVSASIADDRIRDATLLRRVIADELGPKAGESTP